MPEDAQRAGSGPQPTRTPLFLFATGVENSVPTIENGRVRRDQMEEGGHYGQWARGRKPKLNPHQQREALARRNAGEPMAEIARSYDVHH